MKSSKKHKKYEENTKLLDKILENEDEYIKKLRSRVLCEMGDKSVTELNKIMNHAEKDADRLNAIKHVHDIIKLTNNDVKHKQDEPFKIVIEKYKSNKAE